ncbi:hypothetical protein COLO4_36446 [Corchorus olitorius]|uniref:Uncharacterized protein n=1 Tax=Corchorus olitorius TaxID=93759 RepID=A0A1R3G8Z1_9ROSI|nr:hypothetical protein COLO4_36446 [Corchorus olitorius]
MNQGDEISVNTRIQERFVGEEEKDNELYGKVSLPIIVKIWDENYSAGSRITCYNLHFNLQQVNVVNA